MLDEVTPPIDPVPARTPPSGPAELLHPAVTRARPTLCIVTQGMSEDPSPTRDVSDLVIDAKTMVPPVRRGTVSRAPLIETARSSTCRVVGITAPAGYGKSTLLAEWAASEDRRVAWLSLDRFDDDPSILVELLASA